LLFILPFSCVYASNISLVYCHIPSPAQGPNTQCIYKTSEKKRYVNTNMPYASCLHTLCTIDPKEPTRAICNCPVIGADNDTEAWKKMSVSTVFFEIIHPKYKGNELLEVPAAFSLASQHQTNTCHFDKETNWANCAGRRCKAIYITNNGITRPIAHCYCNIMKSKSFVSAGPRDSQDCKTEKNKLWSAISEQQQKIDLAVIKDGYKRFHPESPAAQ
ncbi:MAG: hypothetical protein KDH94_02735, partial [Coxiellaceae bacterium]|nr:hypothetical protein [Coxiellaceae bacterium]